MRLFIDCEWNGFKGELISMALVAENGLEWYGITQSDKPVVPWVAEHVVPKLNGRGKSNAELRLGLHNFLKNFDAVHIIADWPEDIAHFCNFIITGPGTRTGPKDIKFTMIGGIPSADEISKIPHNALEDARALKRYVAGQ